MFETFAFITDQQNIQFGLNTRLSTLHCRTPEYNFIIYIIHKKATLTIGCNVQHHLFLHVAISLGVDENALVEPGVWPVEVGDREHHGVVVGVVLLEVRVALLSLPEDVPRGHVSVGPAAHFDLWPLNLLDEIARGNIELSYFCSCISMQIFNLK